MPKTRGLENYSDVHYTAADVAARVVNHYRPRLPCLEPCRGAGVFFDLLPPGTEWCELADGRDFFTHTGKYRWIVTNPPFEELTRWMEHAFTLADNVVFVIPLSKYFSSAPRIEACEKYGGVRETLYLGRGRSIGFDIGFPFGAVHFARDYKGPIIWSGVCVASTSPASGAASPGCTITITSRDRTSAKRAVAGLSG